MDREIPKSDHDLLISLWTFLVGVNGGGLIAKFDAFTEKTDGRLDTIEKKMPSLWTCEDHERAEKEYQAKDAEKEKSRQDVRERRKMSKREIWMLIATFIGSLAGLGGVIVAVLALKGMAP
jgi:hypothetical protein